MGDAKGRLGGPVSGGGRQLGAPDIRRSRPRPWPAIGRLSGPPVALATLDQLFDLFLGQIFPCSDLGIFWPAWRDFPFFGAWGYDFQGGFRHMNQCSDCSYFRQGTLNTES